MYDYIEHETLTGVKMVVHHGEFDNYHVQIVDGHDLAFEKVGASGDYVSKIGRAYGFEISNPNIRSRGVVEFQQNAY